MGVKNSSNKLDRVEFEKDRGYKVLVEKMKERKQKENISETEEDSSDEDRDMPGIKKKMSRRQRDEARRRTAGILKKAGSTFPMYEEEATSSAGNESSVGCKRRAKVKSGATVKHRPVKIPQTWPNTIANEDDGDDVTSESISLAKFLSCFTYLMTSCEDPEEASGRANLLHAVSSVLEYLPWTDARSFHNMAMLKLEQCRITWQADFTELANQFVDKKVRQSLRAKSKSSNSTGSRSSFRSFGKGFSGSSQRDSYGRSSAAYFNVCKQWNQGTCFYGDRCRRKHVCWTCYEEGKKDEHHKSSTHGSSARSSGQSQQRS